MNSVGDGIIGVENDDNEYGFIVGSKNVGGMINVLVGGIFLKCLLILVLVLT